MGDVDVGGASPRIVTGEIPLLAYLDSNLRPSSGLGTVLGGQFDWGGLLLKSNGGAQRYPQCGWQSHKERKGIRVLDCETYKSSRCESRS